MTKRMLFGVCVLVAMMAQPHRVEARGLDDLWDVLDNLSGPGPFSGWFVTGKVACWEDGEKKVTKALSNPNPTDLCLYLEFHRLHADAKAPYPRVNATIPAAGLSVPLNRFFEVGASVGRAYFKVPDSEDLGATNWVVTPRLVIKPLRIFGRWKDNPRAGFLQMQYRPMVRFGDINGANFGAPPETFSSGTEVLWRSGSYVVFDIFEALRGTD
jgi:hypothetical protein